jgi:hypothetical protein
MRRKDTAVPETLHGTAVNIDLRFTGKLHPQTQKAGQTVKGSQPGLPVASHNNPVCRYCICKSL